MTWTMVILSLGQAEELVFSYLDNARRKQMPARHRKTISQFKRRVLERIDCLIVVEQVDPH